jgi:hypothetical protein
MSHGFMAQMSYVSRILRFRMRVLRGIENWYEFEYACEKLRKYGEPNNTIIRNIL